MRTNKQIHDQYIKAQQIISDVGETFVKRAQNNHLDFTVFTKLDYQVGWHHRALSKVLMRWLTTDEINHLMVFAPPRHGKSEQISRRLPPFIFGKDPSAEIISCSYSASLANAMAGDVKKIMEDETYNMIFPDTRIGAYRDGDKLKKGKLTASEIEIIKTGGHYRAAGVNGPITGKGANYLLIDDPIKNREEANSQVYRDKTFNWFVNDAYTRLEKGGKVLIVMTRWHEDDLCGRLLKEFPGLFTVFSLPAIAEDRPYNEFSAQFDLRPLGEPLWPAKYDLEALEIRKKIAGTLGWSSLYQQRPVPMGGATFKNEWWKWYKIKPQGIRRIYQFWDTAQKIGISNDYSVCATWAETDSGVYLLDIWRDKLEAPDLERMIQMKYNAYRPSGVVIEDKSSGSSLIQNIRRKTTIPVLPYVPKFDKEVRAAGAAPMVEAGNCFLPEDHPNIDDFVNEHSRFPNDVHDDMVDTTSMMYEYFFNRDEATPRVRQL